MRLDTRLEEEETERTWGSARTVGAPAVREAPSIGSGGRQGTSLAETLDRLARRGFVHSFEPRGTALWCRSSDTHFDAAGLVVESATTVDGATVLGLRDAASGTAGTWVLVERGERERRLLARVTWPAPGVPRLGFSGPEPRPPGEPVLDLSA